MVKPFKEDGLYIEKVGRVIDLRPKEEKQEQAKSISDACYILVVCDKPAIIDQFQQASMAATGKYLESPPQGSNRLLSAE